MIIYSENIYTPEGVRKGYIEIEGKIIRNICTDENELKNKSDQIKDYTDFYIIPGFIDNHVHGWGTGSFWKEGTEEAMYNMKKDLVKVGVTSFLGTTGADSLEKITDTLKEAKKVIDREREQITGAEMTGIHLEGPFIGKEYKGMQKEEYCINPDIDILKEFLNIMGEENIKLMTLAPELDGSQEMIKFCNEKSIVVQAGHTSATFEDMKKAVQAGLKGVTHTYSGMRGFHHRELGVVGAVMYFEELYAEFAKQTGLTVKPEAFDIMYRLKGVDKMLLTTDTVGLSRGDKEFYHYIRKAKFIPEGDKIKVLYDDGHEEVKDRTDYENIKDLELGFLGSVQNILKRGKYSLEEIVKMASYNPAEYIGINDRKGSLESGKDADILVLDKNYDLICTVCRGKIEFEK